MVALNPKHPMSEVAIENAFKFLALVIWKLRRHCPNLAVEITQRDMAEMADVFMANGQRGVVAFKGKGDRVVVQLIDEETGAAIVLDPKLNELSPSAIGMRRLLTAQQDAKKLANRLRHDADTGKLGKLLAYEAAEALEALTWEPAE